MQTPEGVVETAAVQEDDHGLLVIEGFTTGCGEHLFAVDFKIHA
jgi:hypothetical protein